MAHHHAATIHSPEPMLARRTVAKKTTRTAPAPHLGQEGNEHARTHVAIGPNPIESNREGNLRALGAIIDKGINQSVSQSQPSAYPATSRRPSSYRCWCRPVRATRSHMPLAPPPPAPPAAAPLLLLSIRRGSSAGNAARARGGGEICAGLEREKRGGGAIGGGSSP